MRKILLITILTCLIPMTVSAQFYNNGPEGPRKWKQIDTGKYQLLYPDGFERGALRYSSILDTIYPLVNYNFSDPIRKIPIILRTSNQLSNGFVTWAPKREEIVTNQEGDTYALSWDKQVSIHEARHVAQMSIMRTGLTKVMTWFLGEAGISVGLLVVDKWQLEGDATLAETQFAEYGRGLQPEFTLGYRGIAADGKLDFKKNIDPWLYGSYKKQIPNVYEYGYQVLSAAETYLSPTIWYDVVKFSAKYPILIYPRTVYLKKHHGLTYKDIAIRAFSEMDSIWKPTYEIPNSFETLTPEPKHHTNYTNPLKFRDKIIATKWDMDKPSRFVVIDPTTKEEKNIHSTGYITSRPIIKGTKLFWTEYKPHIFYEQENYSVIRTLDLTTGSREVFDRKGINYYVTPLPDGTFATVTHDTQSRSYIRITDATFSTEQKIFKFNQHTTLHSLTYDDDTEKLYFIALDDRGMWIGSVGNEGSIKEVTEPSVVTIRDLKADNGRLYFSSIQSGKNEIHMIDLYSGTEYRQTESKLGSQSPSPDGKTGILFSTYTPLGWSIAQSSEKKLEEISWSRLPQNTLNPKRYKWDVPKIDNIKIEEDSTKTLKTKPFRKFGNGFSLHSWAPLPFTGDLNLTETSPVQLAFGATAFFQSTLSEFQGFATYGWVNNMDWIKGNFSYNALPVKIEVNGEYGGGYQSLYFPSGEIKEVPKLELQPYFGASLSLYLPMNLTRGANLRLLQPSLTIGHYNSRYYRETEKTYGSDIQTLSASVYWSDIRAKGYRSIMPRLGYSLRLSAVGALHRDFSTILAFMGRSYLPGFAQNHSISIAGTAQYQFEYNPYKLSSKSLVPRGGIVNNRAAKGYAAVQSSYVLPLACPDGGIEGILYLKRISAEIFGDFSRGNYYANTLKGYSLVNHYSTGVIIGIENNFIGILPNTMYMTFAHNSSQQFWYGVSFSLNF